VAGRVDELEVVRVQAASNAEIGRDQCTQSLALNLSDLLDLVGLTFSKPGYHGSIVKHIPPAWHSL
jgi:hypothetical protein